MRKMLFLNKSFTLVEVLVVVAILALLSAVGIPYLIRSRVQSNDTLAKATLRALSTATETYSNVNAGNYPLDVTSLTGATPPFIQIPYCDQIVSGFTYSCAFAAGTYSFSATPLTVATTGTTTWTISTGGVLTP